jgi:hypothetical protein
LTTFVERVRIWKQAAKAYFKLLSQHSPGETEEVKKIFGTPNNTEIRTGYLPNSLLLHLPVRCHLQLLSQHSTGRTEENHEKAQPGHEASEPRTETGTALFNINPLIELFMRQPKFIKDGSLLGCSAV